LVGCKTCKGTHIMNMLIFQSLKKCPKLNIKPEIIIGERFGELEVISQATEKIYNELTVTAICRSCGIHRKDYRLSKLRNKDGPRACAYCAR